MGLADRFKLRVNGTPVQKFYLRPKIEGGYPNLNKQELVVKDPIIGEFAVEGSVFELEVSDSDLSTLDKSWLPNKGWVKVTVDGFLNMLKPQPTAA